MEGISNSISNICKPQAVIDRVNTSLALNGRSVAELREHLRRETATAPMQGFKNLPIIQGILDAIKRVKK